MKAASWLAFSTSNVKIDIYILLLLTQVSVELGPCFILGHILWAVLKMKNILVKQLRVNQHRVTKFNLNVLYFDRDVFQVFGWTSAGFPQKRSSSCDLLPLVALAGSAVPPWTQSCRPLWICLSHQEGWSMCQPLSLPEGGDTKWVFLIATCSTWL